jgi:hypothetical protein
VALLAAGSALVAGSHLEKDMQTQSVRVVRAFYYQGKPTKVGTMVELPKVFAKEMIAARKAEEVEAPTRAPEKAPEAPRGGDRAR